MVDQASVNGRGATRVPGSSSAEYDGVAEFVDDLASLAELQAQLAAADFREAARKSAIPILLTGVGLAVIMASVPVALFAAGWLLALVPLTANRDLKSYAAAANGLGSSLWHLAMTFATDFVVQLNGCAVSFHSSMKAASRSASFSLLGKSTILSRFLLRMLNHCSTWFIHEQWTGG